MEIIGCAKVYRSGIRYASQLVNRTARDLVRSSCLRGGFLFLHLNCPNVACPPNLPDSRPCRSISLWPAAGAATGESEYASGAGFAARKARRAAEDQDRDH